MRPLAAGRYCSLSSSFSVASTWPWPMRASPPPSSWTSHVRGAGKSGADQYTSFLAGTKSTSQPAVKSLHTGPLGFAFVVVAQLTSQTSRAGTKWPWLSNDPGWEGARSGGAAQCGCEARGAGGAGGDYQVVLSGLLPHQAEAPWPRGGATTRAFVSGTSVPAPFLSNAFRASTRPNLEVKHVGDLQKRKHEIGSPEATRCLEMRSASPPAESGNMS